MFWQNQGLQLSSKTYIKEKQKDNFISIEIHLDMELFEFYILISINEEIQICWNEDFLIVIEI